MENLKNKMQDIAEKVKNELPQGYGFIVLVYPHNETGELLYVSNSNRVDVVKSMKEFIEKTERDYANDTVMVHGAMWYQCGDCGKTWRMWLEVGVEGKNQLMPCPFMIKCKCGGTARHIDWQHDLRLPEPRPLFSWTISYFKLDREGLSRNDGNACGIPIIRD